MSKLFTPVNVVFENQNMQKMFFSPYSETTWSISPPSLTKFINDFDNFSNEEKSYVEIKSEW